MSDALRNKDYERFGFIIVNDKIPVGEMQKRLNEIEFNYASLNFKAK